jgi:hypothetical protein
VVLPCLPLLPPPPLLPPLLLLLMLQRVELQPFMHLPGVTRE